MKKFFLLITIAATIICRPIVSKACSCVVGPNDENFFSSLEYVWKNWPVPGVLFVKGKIVGPTNGYGTRLKILSCYNTDTERDTVTVWGDAGADCRITLHAYYKIGDTVIAALRPTYDREPIEMPDDFFVSSCGFSYLLVKGDSVFGGNYQSFTFRGFPLTSFDDSLQHKIDSLNAPLGVSRPELQGFGLTVYPNPAIGDVSVQWLQKTAGEVRITLIDMTGRVVWVNNNEIYTAGDHKIPIGLKGLSNGSYFVQLSYGSERQVVCLGVLR